MSECNAIIEANNEIDRLKRENKKLNALCIQYGFDMGKLEEENELLKQTIKGVYEILSIDVDVFSDSMSSTEIIDKLNELTNENERLKEELGSFEQVSFTDLCDGSRTVLYMKKENVGDVE